MGSMGKGTGEKTPECTTIWQLVYKNGHLEETLSRTFAKRTDLYFSEGSVLYASKYNQVTYKVTYHYQYSTVSLSR